MSVRHALCAITLFLLGATACLGEDPTMEDEPKYTNRLIDEKSPYLLQHAHNPVDWRPWGEEAFEAAAKEGKPVFLSIGYSTCHWCHVMEHESFEDEEVAALLNKYFICVKVDREERPDVDSVYMTAARYLGSGGGWPLTVVMTPEKKPYFAGTYIPKHEKMRMEGLMTLLPKLYQQFRYNSSVMLDAIASVENRIERNASMPRREYNADADPDFVFQGLMSVFDAQFGGFGRGMKFPRSHQMLFLLEYYRRTGEKGALATVKFTLNRIRHGGVYDHVGFGVHRYAVDPAWFVPHFEKMLYNQAQLSLAALRCYEATGDEEFKRLAEEIYTYVLRDMRSPEGAFYSAEDADSEGEEGVFYLWMHDELKETLEADELAFLESVYMIQPAGNWIDRVSGEQQPTNILHIERAGETVLRESGDEGRAKLETIRKKLFDVRVKRIRPSLDDKVLTDWNGLMIASLAEAGRTLDSDEYLDAAKNAYDFIQANVNTEKGLLHRWRDGDAAISGTLADHTALAWSALELYRSTCDVRYLEDSAKLMEVVRENFREESGGFNMTSKNAEKLLMQPIEFDDMAEPSGNSLAFYVFSELAHLTGNVDFEAEAYALEKVYAPSFMYVPDSRSIAALTATRRLADAFEVILVDGGNLDATLAFRKELESEFGDRNIYLVLKTEENADRLAKLAPFTDGQTAIDGKPTAYVCRGMVCLAPATSIEELRKRLEMLPNIGPGE